MIPEISKKPVESDAVPLQFMMVTGTSGSGKTHALKCLEDLGFFCVDNLPPALFQKFTEICAQPGLSNVEALQANGCQVELLFLEAQDDILIRRFSESRRPHPLLPQRPLIEGIQLERERLQGLRSRAHRVLDTSEFSVHDLKAWLIKYYRGRDDDQALKINLLSFGYKFGIPVDVDLVFDVRFLRNPHFVRDLQPLTGEHTEIQQFVLENKEGRDFLGHLRELFAFLLPLFEREQRNYLTIAFGCTGGRHRSVAMSLHMRDILKTLGYDVIVRHREIQKEKVET
jgi:UPF0042 nucleotide-binding protein